MTAPAAVAEATIAMCQAAAEVNRATPGRHGSVVELTPQLGSEVLVSADLHGNRLNFRKIRRTACLVEHRLRHLVLQEVCHGGPTYPRTRGCMSHLLLEDMARLIVEFPGRVHFLLGNHELAELTDYPISKGPCMLNLQFRSGIEFFYGPRAAAVRDAYLEFLESCPLALRLASGVFICHSLPDHVDQRSFDVNVFQQPLEVERLGPESEVFRLLWGRDYRPANAEAFARLVGAELLIHGHEPCLDGYACPNQRQIILDCSHRSGCCLLVPVTQPASREVLVRSIRRLDGHCPEAGS